MSVIIETRFGIGDYVMVDGCSSIKCVVTAIKVCDLRENISYEIGWFDGDLKSGDVDEWRLSDFEASRNAIAAGVHP